MIPSSRNKGFSLVELLVAVTIMLILAGAVGVRVWQWVPKARVARAQSDIHAAAQPSEAFSLILKEKEGERYVPVIIGMSEARAILVELNQSPTHRPLTHELFVSLADHCGCLLQEIYKQLVKMHLKIV